MSIRQIGMQLTRVASCGSAWTALIVLAIIAQNPAYAVDPQTRISQYAHSAWRVRDGFFSASPTAVAQTRDGFLWVGTESGLVRYDGEHFDKFQPALGQSPLSRTVKSLVGTKDGSLWVGTVAGIAQIRNDQIIDYKTYLGRVNRVVEGSDGGVWYARSRPADNAGPLCHVSLGEIRCFGKPDGIAGPYGDAVMADFAGHLWIGGATALTQWQPAAARNFGAQSFGKGESLGGIQALACSRDGAVYVGTEVTGAGGGLRQLVNGSFRTVMHQGFDGSHLSIAALLMDREGALWIGTSNDGIYRIWRESVEHYRQSSGLSGDSIRDLFEDREGTIWAATTRGIDNFRDLRVLSFTTAEGLSSDDVDGIGSSREGSLWIGVQSGLDILKDGVVTSFRTKDGLPGKQVTSILQDDRGRWWMGIDQGLYVYDHGTFKQIVKPSGRSIGTILSLAEDTSHTFWAVTVGTSPSLLRVANGEVIEEHTAPELPQVTVVRSDNKGGVWLGFRNGTLGHLVAGKLEKLASNQEKQIRQIITFGDEDFLVLTGAGVFGYTGGFLQTLGTRNGLPKAEYYAALFDHAGNLWVMTNQGMLQIPKAQFDNWWKHPRAPVEFSLLDERDGVLAADDPFDERTAVTADGKLWFATEGNGVLMIDPSRQSSSRLPPPIQIESLTADHRAYRVNSVLVLPPLTRSVEIRYAALSFISPEKIHFRYKLSGYDREWQDLGNRKTAYFENLRPGKYHFQITASNGDNVWNKQDSSLDFTIVPKWYQTQWFLVVCIATVLLVALISYHVRVRFIARALSARFEARVEERTRIARELHDTFLQTIQGSKMVADDALVEGADETRMRNALLKLSGWLEQAISEGRAALRALRASTEERYHLAESLRCAAEEISAPVGRMAIEVDIVGEPRHLHPIVREELCQIGFEAVRNVTQHSGANRLKIELVYSNVFAMRVRDNGIGIPDGVVASGKEGHFGIKGMRERAFRVGGKLVVLTAAQEGTEISVSIPGSVAYQTPVSRSAIGKLKRLFNPARKTDSMFD